MGFERRMHPVLAEDLNILLTDLCTEWDFCAGVRAADLLEGSKPLTSKKFTDAVLDAESELPGPRAGWERRIKRKFVQRYGHEVSTKTYSI